jgi:hypothetical protein
VGQRPLGQRPVGRHDLVHRRLELTRTRLMQSDLD